MKRARRNFVTAVEKADELRIPKFQMKAPRSLAEMHRTPAVAVNDLYAAGLTMGRLPTFSHGTPGDDLHKVTSMIWHTIQASQESVFAGTHIFMAKYFIMAAAASPRAKHLQPPHPIPDGAG